MWSYRLDHLEHMSCSAGLYEHALFTEPRPEHGCCTDDNARLLVVMSRETDEGIARDLGHRALHFVLDAQADSGLVHNRFMHDGYWRWVDEPSTEDHWGRALWALGVAAADHPNAGVRASARWGFEKSARQRSPWRRSMAFAALGAAALVSAEPDHDIARNLLVDAVVEILPAAESEVPWPESRLSYANGALAEAVIAAGAALGADEVTNRGLAMLRWLMDTQVRGDHLSVVGVGGRELDDRRVQFDQQPIEVSSLADACWRAWRVTGDDRWRQGIAMAADWFLGRNDAGAVMADPLTGGGYDGLESMGRNLNEGAESTLALVSTMQRATALPMGDVEREPVVAASRALGNESAGRQRLSGVR